MAEFFPRQSIAWRLEEPSALRRFTVAIVPYALVTGVVLRLFRWFVLAVLQPASPLLFLAMVLVALALFATLTAGHLANFTLKSWRWRAPLVGLLVAVGESLTSLGLTALGTERIGRTDIATYADWLPSTLLILWSRVILVVIFAIVLAVTVTVMRRTLHEPPLS
jgi:hypothetical protein